MSQKPTMRSTKEAIFNAYEGALEEIEKLKTNVYDPQAEKALAERTAKADAGITAAKEAKGLSTLTDDITASIQKHVAKIVTTYDESSAKLQSIEEAILLKQEDLKELYNIEANIDSLAALINAQREAEQKHNNNHAEKLKIQQEELTHIAEIVHKARNEQRAAILEFEKELNKIKERKQEEFNYEFDRDKKIKTDQMNDEVDRLMDSVRVEKQELDARTAEVEAREAKVEELQAKVDAIPSEIDKAVAQAKAINTRTLTAQHELEVEKLKAQFTSENAILANRVEMLEAALETERNAHAKTSTKLETAYSSVERVATASVEGARTEDAVNRVLATMNDKK